MPDGRCQNHVEIDVRVLEANNAWLFTYSLLIYFNGYALKPNFKSQRIETDK